MSKKSETNVSCIVVRKFKDKYTGEIYEVGSTLIVSEKRYKEINKNKTFVEIKD